LISPALAAISHDLQTDYQPERQAEYDARSYCPGLRGSPVITDLLTDSPIHDILDQALGIENIVWDGGQIAIRKAHNQAAAVPPDPHLDGFSSGANGLQPGRIYNHTALIGVFLTPVVGEFAGNFTVWPKSHLIFETYFRDRGRQALCEAMPRPAIGDPLQLQSEVGDVVLAHYHLGHTAAVNTSDVDRIAVFFRVSLRNAISNQWNYLTHLWQGWRLPGNAQG
jgi:hypothetical protein